MYNEHPSEKHGVHRCDVVNPVNHRTYSYCLFVYCPIAVIILRTRFKGVSTKLINIAKYENNNNNIIPTIYASSFTKSDVIAFRFLNVARVVHIYIYSNNNNHNNNIYGIILYRTIRYCRLGSIFTSPTCIIT